MSTRTGGTRRHSATARRRPPPALAASAFAPHPGRAAHGFPPAGTELLSEAIDIRRGQHLPNCPRNAAPRHRQSHPGHRAGGRRRLVRCRRPGGARPPDHCSTSKAAANAEGCCSESACTRKAVRAGSPISSTVSSCTSRRRGFVQELAVLDSAAGQRSELRICNCHADDRTCSAWPLSEPRLRHDLAGAEHVVAVLARTTCLRR